MQPKELPIGYWLKKADNLLTKGIDAIQLKFGIDRTIWQLLNLMNGKNSLAKADLSKLMQPFADENAIAAILAKLEEKDLIEEQEQSWRLTPKGAALHKACFEEQKIFRQKSTRSISAAEYHTTLLTLKKLVENLEA